VLTVGDGTAAVSPLVLNSGTAYGNVDLGSNGLVVDIAVGGEVAALSSVREAARSAYGGGTWAGNGLKSSAITPSNRLAIGFGLPADASAATVTGGQFFGVAAVDDSSVVARLTVGGDANLDATVNFDDLLALAKNYNRTDAYWAKGDFNYDGNVNFDDLLVLAKNYNQTAAGPVPGASADFNADVAAAFAAAVPEPGSAGMLCGAALALAGRRRRRGGGGR
jgi:hypothetical protein